MGLHPLWINRDHPHFAFIRTQFSDLLEQIRTSGMLLYYLVPVWIELGYKPPPHIKNNKQNLAFSILERTFTRIQNLYTFTMFHLLACTYAYAHVCVLFYISKTNFGFKIIILVAKSLPKFLDQSVNILMSSMK